MNFLVCAALFASAAVTAASADILVSPTPMTNNQAVMYCADLGSRLLDVTSVTTASVNQHLAGKVAWIGSWDYNFYNRACIAYSNGHIGTEDCSALHFAACNPVNLHPDHNVHVEQDHQYSEHDQTTNDHYWLKSTGAHGAKEPTENVHERKSAGPRVSRRGSRNRHQKDFISSDVSSCSSSSGPDCLFEYVYLTNTVTQVWTVTNFITIGTVAAYVVTTAAA